jgi:hypothetical protein
MADKKDKRRDPDYKYEQVARESKKEMDMKKSVRMNEKRGKRG